MFIVLLASLSHNKDHLLLVSLCVRYPIIIFSTNKGLPTNENATLMDHSSLYGYKLLDLLSPLRILLLSSPLLAVLRVKHWA